MNGTTSDRRKIGEIRPTQLLFTGGVGAIVELPNLSVMVMGLDDWPIEQGATEISEPRLLKAVQYELGPQVVKLLTPPVTSDSVGMAGSPFDDTANVGVPVAPFPRWQVCRTAGSWPRSSGGCSSSSSTCTARIATDTSTRTATRRASRQRWSRPGSSSPASADTSTTSPGWSSSIEANPTADTHCDSTSSALG